MRFAFLLMIVITLCGYLSLSTSAKEMDQKALEEYYDSDEYYDKLVLNNGMICDEFNQCWGATRFCCMNTCTPTYEYPGQITKQMCGGIPSYNNIPDNGGGRHGYF